MGEFRASPVKSEIGFDEFSRVDIRAGTIERVEDIEKSDKLVKLTVSSGTSPNAHPRSCVPPRWNLTLISFNRRAAFWCVRLSGLLSVPQSLQGP